jgi:hypothetical protein
MGVFRRASRPFFSGVSQMSRALLARAHAATLAAGLLTLGSLAFLADPAAAGRLDATQDPPVASQDPPGRNGDIKITAVDDESTPPENNPMQGCSLAVEWYDFDAGDLLSHLTFEAVAPTADAVLEVEGLLDVQIGEDAAGGGTDRDAREVYTFTTAGEPGPQGFHIKLEVHTPGVTGAEKKSKVFWIGDCSDAVPPTEAPPTEPPTEEPPREDTPGGPVVEPPVDTPADPVDPVDVPDGSESSAPVVGETLPLSVDAGERGSASEDGENGLAPGLLLAGGLLAMSGYLVARTPRTRGARRR